jgi:peptidoglycan/xylan/chitin deacetylase (PgdA/CDA1 family)
MIDIAHHMIYNIAMNYKYKLLSLLLVTVIREQAVAQSVYITFDDLPHYNGVLLGDKNTIIDTLKKHEVPPVIGFVNGIGAIIDDTEIRDWVKSGNLIGNHTFSHPDLAKIGPADFISDIVKNEIILNKHSKDYKYFRYPFLSEGKTREEKAKVSNFLKNSGYQSIPVTIDIQDWRWNSKYIECRDIGIDTKDLVLAYIHFMIMNIKSSSALSIELLGKDVPHVILLHTNAINNIALDQMLSEFKKNNISFITIDKVKNEPLYKQDIDFFADYGTNIINQIVGIMNHNSKLKLDYYSTYNKTINSINNFCKNN